MSQRSILGMSWKSTDWHSVAGSSYNSNLGLDIGCSATSRQTSIQMTRSASHKSTDVVETHPIASKSTPVSSCSGHNLDSNRNSFHCCSHAANHSLDYISSCSDRDCTSSTINYNPVTTMTDSTCRGYDKISRSSASLAYRKSHRDQSHLAHGQASISSKSGCY